MTAHFEKLEVWQLAYNLALEVYRSTKEFPRSETYGLASQLRRAAVAVIANIAEGNARRHAREYVQFCHIARGSVAETKCLLKLSAELGYLSAGKLSALTDGYERVGAMLQALINRLEEKARLGAR